MREKLGTEDEGDEEAVEVDVSAAEEHEKWASGLKRNGWYQTHHAVFAHV